MTIYRRLEGGNDGEVGRNRNAVAGEERRDVFGGHGSGLAPQSRIEERRWLGAGGLGKAAVATAVDRLSRLPGKLRVGAVDGDGDCQRDVDDTVQTVAPSKSGIEGD